MSTARLVSGSQLPKTPRLAPGRSVLWRSQDCVQLGLDATDAMVLDGLSPPLAALIEAMDGTSSATRLVTDAVAAGAVAEEAVAVIRQLQGAGLVTDDPEPPAEPGPAAVDAAAWSMRTRLPARELLRSRGAATVDIRGSGRIAVALSTALASSGVGRVRVDADGAVAARDRGTGYLAADVGRPRTEAAADVLARSVPDGRTGTAGTAGTADPDVVVLTDSVVCRPQPDLVTRAIPHLPTFAHEQLVTVGPLVAPGRTPCLRCLALQRAEADPVWPKLAAQLARAAPSSDVGCAQIAAGMAAEQVLGVLAGPTSGLPQPSSWGATVQLDPVTGRMRREVWSAHPDCGCGAAAAPAG